MAVGAIIEIVEKSKEPVDEGTILVPNCVRINGQELYTSDQHPITVDKIETGGGVDCVYVTLTLMARRVVMDDEVTA